MTSSVDSNRLSKLFNLSEYSSDNEPATPKPSESSYSSES